MKSPCELVNELTSHNQEVRLGHGQGDGRGPGGRSTGRRSARPECVKSNEDEGTASAGAGEGIAQAGWTPEQQEHQDPEATETERTWRRGSQSAEEAPAQGYTTGETGSGP